MSLDFYLLEIKETEVYWKNITHNLNRMAIEVKLENGRTLYDYLWHPTENGFTQARHLIKPLEEGLQKLEANPEYFKQFNSPNGWGIYEHFVSFVRDVLEGCKKHPNARIEVSI